MIFCLLLAFACLDLVLFWREKRGWGEHPDGQGEQR